MPRSLNDPLKRTITLSLGLLDDENEGGTADDWVDAIDRGGLTRVNENDLRYFFPWKIGSYESITKALRVKRCVNLDKSSMKTTLQKSKALRRLNEHNY